MPARIVVALDFETANRYPDSACQLGLVRMVDWSIRDCASFLIRPPEGEFLFTYLHGIDRESVAHEPDWGELWPRLSGWFEGADYLAAHNASFDQGVLQATCARFGLQAPQVPFLDTVSIARNVWGIYPTKLNLVCERLGIELNHHEALSDAKACAEILARAHAERWSQDAKI